MKGGSMDFSVIVDEPRSVLTDSTPSTSTPGTPELSAARAEYAKVMNDPTHKHYEGFKRGDKAADAYVSELYKKALSHPAAPSIRAGDHRGATRPVGPHGRAG
jgi:hypothetical protein